MSVAADPVVAALKIEPQSDPTRVVVSCPLDAAQIAELSARPAVDEALGRELLTLSLVEDDGRAATLPLFGSYSVRDGRLIFEPRFGLVRGSRYRAAAVSNQPGAATVDYVVPPVEAAPPTTVVDVKPVDDRVPANLLKFYIRFSRPMREGREVLERIRLFEVGGSELVAPWRDIELWNHDATRLTLFIHPGRIKQGVNLRDDFGPVLAPGKTYELVVGADLRDARGVELGKPWTKRFTAGEEVRSKIEVAKWRLSEVRKGTRDELVVDFDRPLDAALAERCLHLRDSAGGDLDGVWKVADDVRRATFTPRSSWRAEGFFVAVDPELEDRSGNTPTLVFDNDLEVVDVLPPVLMREFQPK